MSIDRSYSVSAHVAPGIKPPPETTLYGGYSFGPHDAAKKYAGLCLAGYEVISCRFVKVQNTEKHGLHSLWKVEAVNHEQQLGAAIYVREL